MEFNIYYLNFSKVFETEMLINNIIKEEILQESGRNKNKQKKFGLTSENLSADYHTNKSEYVNLTETLKVKHTKSISLKKILKYCKNLEKDKKYSEGDLIKINDIKINFFDDEQNQRMLSLLSKEIFSGINVEGVDVSNLISKYIHDSAYLLKFNYENKTFVFKIPMENNTEFESKYSINDLLIGKLSIIGVYKGQISEKEFKKSNLLSTLENDENQDTYNIVDSNNSNEETNNINSNDKQKLFYIDVFAIIQNINVDFNEVGKQKSILKKIKQIFRRKNE